MRQDADPGPPKKVELTTCYSHIAPSKTQARGATGKFKPVCKITWSYLSSHSGLFPLPYSTRDNKDFGHRVPLPWDAMSQKEKQSSGEWDPCPPKTDKRETHSCEPLTPHGAPEAQDSCPHTQHRSHQLMGDLFLTQKINITQQSKESSEVLTELIRRQCG